MLNFFHKSFSKVKNALSKTRALLSSKLKELLKGKIDASTIEQVEELFYEADLGVKTSSELADKIATSLRDNPQQDLPKLIESLQTELLHLMQAEPSSMAEAETGKPTVILVIGVNGNGKTTSVAKLANLYKEKGKKVIIAAADTFRAAATQQLEIWANRLEIELVKSKPKSDPSAVAFDAVTAAIARGADVLIIDTAGRLHTKVDLMNELQKIKRACTKVLPGAPHETLLVLDATTGQNALDQAKTFHRYTPITGLILTKLDGTAKGGIAVAIHKELNLPVKFIGVGEGLEDLEPFNPEAFVKALFD